MYNNSQSTATPKRQIFFCNIAYMDHYNGTVVGDPPRSGGSYPKKHKDCGEKWNFYLWNDGFYRGFVETGYHEGYEIGQRNKNPNKIGLEKFGKEYKNEDKIEHVTVVFCSNRKEYGAVIVGWYKDATVFRDRQKHPHIEFGYNLMAHSSNCVLLDEDERTRTVPRARFNKDGLYGFGQCNYWFANEPEAQDYVKGVFDYIDSYTGESMPTEIYQSGEEYVEEYSESGVKKVVKINHYERNSKAREACLKLRGHKCAICGFDAKAVYGDEYEGKIHVHHIVPISERGVDYVINPQTDLIPVCPNCHMILHTSIKGKTIDVEELKRRVKKA